MKKIGFITSLLIPFLSANIAYAMPKDCPSAVAIQAVGISTNVVKFNNAWAVGRRNQTYETPDHWTFLIINIRAANALQAYQKGATALQSLVFQAGPISAGENKSICAYNTIEGYSAFAVNPPSSLLTAAQTVSR